MAFLRSRRRSAAPRPAATAGGTRGTASKARAAVVGALLAVILLLVFAGQNSARADVHFLWLSWSSAPLYAVILVSFLVGVIAGGLLVFRRGRRPSAVTASAAAPAPAPVDGRSVAERPPLTSGAGPSPSSAGSYTPPPMAVDPEATPGARRPGG